MDEQICQNMAAETEAGVDLSKDAADHQYLNLEKIEAEKRDALMALRLQAQFDSAGFDDLYGQ